MPRSLRYALAALVTALLSLSALSSSLQDPEPEPEPRKVAVSLKSGKRLHGSIVQIDGQRVQLRLSVSGGTSVQWYDIDDFDDRSRVRLRREQVAEGDVLAQLAVAEYAAELGLIDLSRTELRRCAHMLDSGDAAPPAAFRQRAIDLTLRLLERFCERGDVSEARSAVSRLLTRRSSELSEEEQARFLATVEDAAARLSDGKAAERRAKEDAKTSAARKKHLDAVDKRVAKAQALRRKGLLASRSYSASSRDLRGAVKQFEAALKEIEKLRKKFDDDAVMLAELDAVHAETLDQWKDCLLATGSLELGRGNFGRARDNVQRVLERDPKHAQALAMRARIEVAENEWGWGLRW
jgi:hypothetical protein